MKEDLDTFTYIGYFTKEAEVFFGSNTEPEESNTSCSIGNFIKLSTGEYHLPSNGDIFTKHVNGSITVKSKYR